jgi:hypothetical protein
VGEVVARAGRHEGERQVVREARGEHLVDRTVAPHGHDGAAGGDGVGEDAGVACVRALQHGGLVARVAQGSHDRVDLGEAAPAAGGRVDDEVHHVRGCYRTGG